MWRPAARMKWALRSQRLWAFCAADLRLLRPMAPPALWDSLEWYEALAVWLLSERRLLVATRGDKANKKEHLADPGGLFTPKGR